EAASSCAREADGASSTGADGASAAAAGASAAAAGASFAGAAAGASAAAGEGVPPPRIASISSLLRRRRAPLMPRSTAMACSSGSFFAARSAPEVVSFTRVPSCRADLVGSLLVWVSHGTGNVTSPGAVATGPHRAIPHDARHPRGPAGVIRGAPTAMHEPAWRVKDDAPGPCGALDQGAHRNAEFCTQHPQGPAAGFSVVRWRL